MTTEIEFVEAMVARFPELRSTYEAHLWNFDELLSHTLFGLGEEGFTDQIVEAYLSPQADALDWRAVLAFFDEYFDRGSGEVDKVLVTSFLYRLPWPGQPGYGLVNELPERLRARFDLVRPAEAR